MLSREVDEAREIGGQIYYPHTLVTLGRERDFQMRIHAAEKAELTVGLLEYASPVRIQTEALSDAYQVNFPLQGQLRMTYGDQKILASPRIAAIHGTDRETGLEGWDSPTTMLGLKIPQRVLDRELEVLLGRTPEAPVVFAGSLDLASRSGREWRSTVEFLAQGLQARESMLGHPLVSGPAAQAVVRGLLLVAPNSYTAELTGDVAAAGPTYVRRAVAFIEDNADQPLTLEQIAEAANISPRALQTGFRTHLESTPISVLRDVRLRRVHEDLLAAAPTDLVSTVARRWGFMHVGRFAIHYAQTFGQSPSETLRNSTKF